MNAYATRILQQPLRAQGAAGASSMRRMQRVAYRAPHSWRAARFASQTASVSAVRTLNSWPRRWSTLTEILLWSVQMASDRKMRATCRELLSRPAVLPAILTLLLQRYAMNA